MLKIYKLDAVHPVAKRIVKGNLKPDEMTKLYNELVEAGYEEKDIQVDVQKVLYQEGDTIEITKEMFDALPDKVDREKPNWIDVHKLQETKNTIRYIFGENPIFPILGVLKKHRVARNQVHLIINWSYPKDEDWNNTNTYILDALGFEFIQPEFDVIPIDECPDDLLGDHDLIIKYLMLENEWTENEVDNYLKPLYNAMKKTGSVFYRP